MDAQWHEKVDRALKLAQLDRSSRAHVELDHAVEQYLNSIGCSCMPPPHFEIVLVDGLWRADLSHLATCPCAKHWTERR